MQRLWWKIRNHQRLEKVNNFFYKSEELRIRITRFRHTLENHFKGKLLKCHCGSIFSGRRNLDNHQLIHSGEVECEFCSANFEHEAKLRYHMKMKHPFKIISRRKKPECEFCQFLSRIDCIFYFPLFCSQCSQT